VIHKVAFVMALLLIVVLSVSTPGAGKKKSGKGKKKAQGIPMAIADLQEKIDDLQDQIDNLSCGGGPDSHLITTNGPFTPGGSTDTEPGKVAFHGNGRECAEGTFLFSLFGKVPCQIAIPRDGKVVALIVAVGVNSFSGVTQFTVEVGDSTTALAVTVDPTVMGGLGNYFIEVDVDVFAGELVTLKTAATASIG